MHLLRAEIKVNELNYNDETSGRSKVGDTVFVYL